MKGDARTIQRNRYLVGAENGLSLPASVTTNTGLGNAEEERVKILKYDVYGNPVHIQKDGNSAVYLWSYGGQYLVTEIVGATFEDVERSLSSVGISSIPVSYTHLKEPRLSYHPVLPEGGETMRAGIYRTHII